MQDTLGVLALFLLATLALAHILGDVFSRLRQPRVIGEILAGLVMGPLLVGRFWVPMLGAHGPKSLPPALDLFYWLGLLLLMFLSGAETQGLFGRYDRKETVLLASIGTGIPFVIAVSVVSWLSLPALTGEANSRSALVLVVGIAVAVTSIPVISKIFFDLGILKTRFARLILGVAVMEDVALWAVLAIATTLAKGGGDAALPTGMIARQVAITLAYFAFGLTIAPALLRKLHESRWNLLRNINPTAYLLGILFLYVAVAGALKVNLVFAAFLAGMALPRESAEGVYAQSRTAIKNISFALFIPIYFALVGYQLDLGKSFSLSVLLIFMTLACIVKLASVILGARVAGFRGLDVVNLAVATNARGGPGIVLASVAYAAGIISPVFYTTLVLMAVFTSQAAGAWLEYVLKRGWPLLSGPELVEAVPDAAPGRIAA